MVIDYVNGHDEFDGCIWFEDGEYVGHDDQIDLIHYTPENKETTLVVRHRKLRRDLTLEQVDEFLSKSYAANIEEVEDYLVPVR